MFRWLKRMFTIGPQGPVGIQGPKGPTWNAAKLYDEMQKQCPSCHRRPPIWMEGPQGGLCINAFCGHCGQGYNITPIAEIIHKEEKYIVEK